MFLGGGVRILYKLFSFSEIISLAEFLSTILPVPLAFRAKTVLLPFFAVVIVFAHLKFPFLSAQLSRMFRFCLWQ